jgi:hypothetical protein
MDDYVVAHMTLLSTICHIVSNQQAERNASIIEQRLVWNNFVGKCFVCFAQSDTCLVDHTLILDSWLAFQFLHCIESCGTRNSSPEVSLVAEVSTSIAIVKDWKSFSLTPTNSGGKGYFFLAPLDAFFGATIACSKGLSLEALFWVDIPRQNIQYNVSFKVI